MVGGNTQACLKYGPPRVGLLVSCTSPYFSYILTLALNIKSIILPLPYSTIKNTHDKQYNQHIQVINIGGSGDGGGDEKQN